MIPWREFWSHGPGRPSLFNSALRAATADAATANAYAAGVAAGSAYAIGAIHPTLPSGCIVSGIGESTYYHRGVTIFFGVAKPVRAPQIGPARPF